MKMFSINGAARELGCSETFLRRAEQHSKIPRAKRDINGWRVYTPEDIACLRQVLLPIRPQKPNKVCTISKYYKMPREVLSIAILLTLATWALLFVVPPMETILVRELSVIHFPSLFCCDPIFMFALLAVPATFFTGSKGIKRAAGIGAILVFVVSIPCGIAIIYYICLLFHLSTDQYGIAYYGLAYFG